MRLSQRRWSTYSVSFFLGQSSGLSGSRGSLQLALDGKTRKPAYQCAGHHQSRGALWRDQLACSRPRTPPLTGIDPWPLGVENGLPSRRDATMREEHSQIRTGHAPHLLAILANIVFGLLVGRGRTNLAEARWEIAYQFDHSLASLAV